MSKNEQINRTAGDIEVLPIAGRIGAEIKGVSLHAELDTQSVQDNPRSLIAAQSHFLS